MSTESQDLLVQAADLLAQADTLAAQALFGDLFASQEAHIKALRDQARALQIQADELVSASLSLEAMAEALYAQSADYSKKARALEEAPADHCEGENHLDVTLCTSTNDGEAVELIARAYGVEVVDYREQTNKHGLKGGLFVFNRRVVKASQLCGEVSETLALMGCPARRVRLLSHKSGAHALEIVSGSPEPTPEPTPEPLVAYTYQHFEQFHYWEDHQGIVFHRARAEGYGNNLHSTKGYDYYANTNRYALVCREHTEGEPCTRFVSRLYKSSEACKRDAREANSAREKGRYYYFARPTRSERITSLRVDCSCGERQVGVTPKGRVRKHGDCARAGEAVVIPSELA